MNALKHELLDNGCCFSYSSLNNSKQILFLDRDGVINKDTGYVHKITDLELLEKNNISYHVFCFCNCKHFCAMFSGQT